jgi:hypothetical protein
MESKGGSTMWLFSQHGMISAVKHKYMPGHLMVRARYEKDIRDLAEKLGKHGYNATCKETPDADYRWRLTCTKSAFEKVMVDMVKNIDYTNFKNRVHEEGDKDRDHAYMGVWSDMYGFQQDKYNPKPKYSKTVGGFNLGAITDGMDGDWAQDENGNWYFYQTVKDQPTGGDTIYTDFPEGETVAGAPDDWKTDQLPRKGSAAWESLFDQNEPPQDGEEETWDQLVFDPEEGLIEVETFPDDKSGKRGGKRGGKRSGRTVSGKRGNRRGAKAPLRLHELPDDEFALQDKQDEQYDH